MTRPTDGITFDTTLRLDSLRDPVVDALGHDPRSTYVERFWLPILGPSTTWLLRLFNNYLDDRPGGCEINISDTARSLGLGDRRGQHGPFLRSLNRAIDFDMARIIAPGSVIVRRLLPALSPRHLSRLPETLQREHISVVRHVGAPVEAMRRRGQQLALSLMELGEGTVETERQLGLWKFHPSLAHQCTAWAERELATHRSQNRLRPNPSIPRPVARPSGLAAPPKSNRQLEVASHR